jgi:hypothetical protein
MYIVKRSFFPPECSLSTSRMWDHTAGGDTRAEDLNGLKILVRLERKILYHVCCLVY